MAPALTCQYRPAPSPPPAARWSFVSPNGGFRIMETATAPAVAEKPAARAPGTQTPFSPEENARIIDQFTRDGYVIIPGILAPDEVAAFRKRIESYYDDPKMWETKNRCDDLCIL